MATKIKTATVKVMLSHNYNQFEASMSLENDEGLTVTEINNARKDCNRLCDIAVRQYDTAKSIAVKRIQLKNEKILLEREVNQVKQKEESEWSVVDKAKIKALEDHQWELQWDYDDDYDND